MSTDEQHLRLLEVFHYVVGGIYAFFSVFPLIYLGFGVAIVAGAFEGKDPPPALLGWMFIAAASCIVLCGWAFAACLIAAGRMLAKRRRRTFCLVVAALSCLMQPFGTVLGVFSIVVLMRESVRALFDAPAASSGT
jgi:hypothetical protein